MTAQDIGMSLCSRRGFARMTQKQVCEAINISISTLWKWEKGLSSPTATQLYKLADLYSCSTDELIGRA